VYVDSEDYLYYPEIARFTIAREIAHLILHGQIYEQLEFLDIAEYLEWRNSSPSAVISSYVAQAEDFAGLILTPRKELRKECRRIIREKSRDILGLNLPPMYIWSYIAHESAKAFLVESYHIEKRIIRDRIPDKIRFK
jgi:hypothetical protein